MEQMSYAESGIDEKILRGIKELGFEMMTPIQTQAIPVLLEGKDVIGQAQTGTGKTAAFGIPAISSVDPHNRHLQVMVLCPTRELAIQAAEEMRKFAKFTHGIKILPIYGGQDISTQIRSLKGGVQIVVGTPGRVMDHMRRHTIKLNDLKMIILDEADEMLNMGFREDIETILKEIPHEHQTALFSATMPQAILDITNRYQREDAVTIKVAAKELTVPLIKQYYYEVRRDTKLDVVCRLLDYYTPKKTLVFCNTKKMVDVLADGLKQRGYFAEGLHGDLSQHQRDLVMKRFKTDKADILIATDVAARGIDVDDVEAVVNFDIPQDIEYYVHRIGRTGRAGKKGRSFTLVVGREIFKIRDIERSCKTKIKPRTVPSASALTETKAEKIFTDVFEVMKEKDLSKCLRMIEEKLEEEDTTALELAAGFLRQLMGDEPEDIPTESFEFRKRRRTGTSERGRRSTGNRGEASRRTSRTNGRSSERGSERNSGRSSGRNSGKSSGRNQSGRNRSDQRHDAYQARRSKDKK